MVQARALLPDPRSLNDPLLEEVRRFFEENHAGIEASRRRHRYFYDYMTRILRARIPEGQRILDLGCGSGHLLADLGPSQGVGIDVSAPAIDEARRTHRGQNLHFFEGDAADRRLLAQVGGPFDVVLMTNVVTHLTDVQRALEGLHPICHSRTRLFLYSYSRLWQPLLRLGETLGLKYRQPPESWLPPEEIENMLALADFEVVRRDRQVVCPVGLPLLADLLNRLGHLPIVDWGSLIFGIVARPSPALSRGGRVSEPSTSVIIPCRNEAGHIPSLVENLPRLGPSSEFLFVEGNSSDDTEAAILQAIADHPALPLRFLKQTGKGKGDAVRLGFAAARGEIVLILDSDMGVAPRDVPKFVEALVRGKGEMVNGSRMVYPMEGRAMRFLNLVANKTFAMVFSWLLGQQVRDTLCGTKAMYREDYERIAANRHYFGDFDPFGDFDLLFGAARLKLPIVDMPVRYARRTAGVSKVRLVSHGFLLVRMSWIAFRKFKWNRWIGRDRLEGAAS